MDGMREGTPIELEIPTQKEQPTLLDRIETTDAIAAFG